MSIKESYGKLLIEEYIKEQLKESNGRTRSLENWRNYILGGMGILTIIITWSIQWI